MKMSKIVSLVAGLIFCFFPKYSAHPRENDYDKTMRNYDQFVFRITIANDNHQTAFKVKGHPWLITTLHGFLSLPLTSPKDFSGYEITVIQNRYNEWEYPVKETKIKKLLVSGIDVKRDLVYIDITGIPALENLTGIELSTEQELKDEPYQETSVLYWGASANYSPDDKCNTMSVNPIRYFESEFFSASDETQKFVKNKLKIPSVNCRVVPIQETVFFLGNSGAPIVSYKTKKIIGIVDCTISQDWNLGIFLDKNKTKEFKRRVDVLNSPDEKILINAMKLIQENHKGFSQKCDTRVFTPELSNDSRLKKDIDRYLLYDPIDSIAKAYYGYWHSGSDRLITTESAFLNINGTKIVWHFRIDHLRENNPATFEFLKFMIKFINIQNEDGKNTARMKMEADSLYTYYDKVTSNEKIAWRKYGMNFKDEILKMITLSEMKYKDYSYLNKEEPYIEEPTLIVLDSLLIRKEYITAMQSDIQNLLSNPIDTSLIERLSIYQTAIPNELQAALEGNKEIYANSVFKKLTNVYNSLYSMPVFEYKVTLIDSTSFTIQCGIGVSLHDTSVVYKFMGYPVGNYNDDKVQLCVELITDADKSLNKYLLLINPSFKVETNYTGEADGMKWHGNVPYNNKDFVNNKLDTLWVISKDITDDPDRLKHLLKSNNSYKKNKAIAFLRAYYIMEKLNQKDIKRKNDPEKIRVWVSKENGPEHRGIIIRQTFHL